MGWITIPCNATNRRHDLGTCQDLRSQDIASLSIYPLEFPVFPRWFRYNSQYFLDISRNMCFFWLLHMFLGSTPMVFFRDSTSRWSTQTYILLLGRWNLKLGAMGSKWDHISWYPLVIHVAIEHLIVLNRGIFNHGKSHGKIHRVDFPA